MIGKALLQSFYCAIVLVATGCTFRVTDFTVISTKNVNVPVHGKAPRTTGKDCVIVILFPLGLPNLKTAVDRAIEKAGPEYDALIDGVAYFDNYSFLFGEECSRVEGTPVSTKSAGVSSKEQEQNSQAGSAYVGNEPRR